MPGVQVDLGIWDKLSRLIVLLLVLAAVVGLVYLYVPGMRRNEVQRQNLHTLQASFQRELQESNRLKSEVESLFSNDRALERYARIHLNYARSNELVIRFAPTNTPKAAPPARP